MKNQEEEEKEEDYELICNVS